MGRSIRTAEFRYVEWRNAKDRVIARELYDHRNDDSEGLLETSNVVDAPEFAEVATLLSKQLNERIPHTAKKQ